MHTAVPALPANRNQDAGPAPLRRHTSGAHPRRILRQMASAALALMDRAGVDLMDADFDPWSVGAPAYQGLVDHRPVEPSAQQMSFIHTLESVRSIIATNATRPLIAFTAIQNGPTPRDAILLNLLFYLSTDGHRVEPKTQTQQEGTYAVHVVVR